MNSELYKKHSVGQLTEKCVQINWQKLNHAGKTMTQNTLPAQQRTSLGRKRKCMHFRKLKGTPPPPLKKNKQQKQTTERGCSKSITKEECNNLVMSMGYRLDAVIASNGYATNYEVLFTLIYLNTLCSIIFDHLNIGWSYIKGAMF